MSSGNIYACKAISLNSLVKESSKHKLENEIYLHSICHHPNIVKYERHFPDDLNVYILLELCENQTLLELIKKRKQLTETEVKFFMWQLIDVCDYLHTKQRIIHRDLKLGNLFLTGQMNLKLGDFG